MAKKLGKKNSNKAKIINKVEVKTEDIAGLSEASTVVNELEP